MLSGDLTNDTDMDGIVSYADLAVSAAGVYTLCSNAMGYTEKWSSPFTVADAPPAPPFTVILLDGTPTATVSAENGTFESHTFTVSAVPNRAVIGCSTIDSGGETVGTMFLNGEAMTLLGRGLGGSGGVSTSMWYAANPPVGSNTITYSPGFPTRQVIGAAVVYNALLSNPFRAIQTAGSTGGTADTSTFTFTTQPDDFIIDCIGAGRNGDPVDMEPIMGVTEHYDEEGESSPDVFFGGLGTITATDTSTDTGWNWTGTWHYGHVAVVLIGQVVPSGGLRLRLR
jgi:hypothetical protein